MEINFSNIRSHDGSKNSGFEKLICQLAHLQKPEGAETFIKKEGAGGDAGVECYWRMEDSSEIGWQAKYFNDGMDGSRWHQVDESFKAALEKHPNLKKYIVSLPLDRTDSRKKGRGGKKVVSIQDEWDELIQSWTELAKKMGRNIEFEFWGKHELTLFLTIDNPLYSGRALYWFNEPILGFDIFETITHKSQESLGERYTPEFHIDLPIAESFDALGSNREWWERLKNWQKNLVEQKGRFFREFLSNDYYFLNQEQIKQLENICSTLIEILTRGIKQKNAIENIDVIRNLCDQIQDCRENLFKDKKEDHFYDKKFRNKHPTFNNFFYKYQSFSFFLNSKSVNAAKVRAALLYGNAGIGKSHLLCDMALHRIKEKLPTVFLLGQHYGGGNPIHTLKNILDLSNQSDRNVLGALDAAGEAHKTKTLIIIDAINEGLYREDWSNHIRAFLSEISSYKNISVLLSCRTTYLDYILPDSINDDCLIRIQHMGFQGYEHRAAEKYMSKQGISKPSAPILAPEFTNPLFLKTCCQALKDSGLKNFPRGMRGLSRLFDFYMESVEKRIAKRKKYNPAEEIIKNALIEFASKIFPDYLSGLPMADARTLINGFDPNPVNSESVFNQLIDEGVLSEDIFYDKQKKGKPVVRFTYERFSDHSISQQIINQYDEETIKGIFSKGQPLGKIIEENSYYRFEGIFEALSIIVAEKYRIELIDLLPKEIDNQIYDWFLYKIFSETVIWRSANSFSDRTLEILNSLPISLYNYPALDVLLKLSTEPKHPWNANLIHKNLIDRSMAERDYFWSIHIALGDHIEEDGEPESIIRTLIEWACFGEIKGIEEERARLCAITLLWFLTTSNRKVRDQSTKSLVRLLCGYPNLLPELLTEFHHVNDLYLVERLYAVVYGVVCNIDDTSLISDIARIVYDLVFRDGQPMPHILLRDYARGIVEYALHLQLIPDSVELDKFRPPYKSDWPIENPTNEDIDKLVGDGFSQIKNSLMGFTGDFGNYTMSCIHDWSSTLLSEPKPKTGYFYKKEFAEKYLDGVIKEQYLERIKPVKKIPVDPLDLEMARDRKEMNDKQVLIKFIEEKYDKERTEEKAFRKKIEKSLNEEQKEYFRWVNGLNNDLPAAFSRKWAQRWICKRAYDFGWKKELFEDFEKRSSYGRISRSPSQIERIGKKYQWIALHELLARLSDNVHWIDRGYSDIEDKEYYGPWQMHMRDIDPTVWIRSSAEGHSLYNNETTWWQKYRFPLDEVDNLHDQLEFMWSEQIIPDFSKIIEVSDAYKRGEWLALKGFWMQKQEDETEKNQPRLDAWFRINSIVTKKSDFSKIRDSIKEKNLIDPYTVSVPSTGHQGFLGEYPWHPSCRFMMSWIKKDDSWRNLIPVRYLVPISEYEWESGSVDYSLDSSLSFYMPAADLISELKLFCSKDHFGAWVNKKGENIFLDPSVAEKGPSFALMKKEAFLVWLDENDLEILWLIGGEKELFKLNSTFYGRLVYNCMLRLKEGIPEGSIWFEKQPGSKV